MFNLMDSRLPEIFWTHVIEDPASRCWLWTGFVRSDGYGQLKFRGETRSPHRIVYESLVGIPSQPHLDHLCRVRRCCNPAHLEPVTARTNTLRGINFIAINASKGTCIRGHTLEDAFIQTRTRYGHEVVERACRHCRIARNNRRPRKTKRRVGTVKPRR